jgi:oligopeptide/dipeptide ABC transporter ATP-binding protein
MGTVLELKNLTVAYRSGGSIAPAVRRINLSVPEASTLGIVGESGSGKTALVRAVARLLPANGLIVAGAVLFKGRDLTGLSTQVFDQEIRAQQIGFVMQDPMTALNPMMMVGRQIAEPLRLHRGLSNRAALDRAVELLDMVGIRNAKHAIWAYPHEFSGGMRQRVVIAAAIACNPSLIIADEPTTALDATVQKRVLDLLEHMRESLGSALILISHDLGVVAHVADRIAVMYAGEFVETGPTRSVLSQPFHPYTSDMLSCVTSLAHDQAGRFFTIPGQTPDPLTLPRGCSYASRCSRAIDRCAEAKPPLKTLQRDRAAACWLSESSHAK